MLKTQSNEWLLKETNTGFLQSPTEQQNNLAAHINYGFVSSTNSLSWPSVDDCRYALTPALPQKCDSDVGQGHIPCTLECSTSTKPSDCSLKSRKRKRDPSPGTCKRPRSCYDQAPVENEKENNELPPPYKGFEDIPFGTPAGEEYWTDEELNKAIAIDEEASECKENKVVSIQKYGYNKLDQDLETKLGKNLKAFQRYIEKCVKPTDMIVFFDKFSPEQRKLLQQTKSKYTIKANRQIFDVINAMKDTPDKYTSLLHACEEGGYPKVSEILMGRLAPKSRKHRQTISKAAKHIYQRLSVCDVMPYLLQKGVINTFDMQEVKATAATCEAAIELLLLLPNRSRQWYCLLIEALVESNQCELAQLIDKKMTEEIQENTYNRSLCSTSLESVCKATPQTPLTDIVLEHPIRDSIIYLETLPEEPDDVHYGPQYHIQLTRFASFRKSLKKTYHSIVKFPFKRKGLTGQ